MSERQGLRRYLFAFSRLSASEKAKVIERLRAILRRYVEQKASPTLLFAIGRLIAQLEARST